ncbi:hypothetical protein EAI_17383 [Harpegnathos saltator]|uniref:Uncharacterized protein n=1 Tax=Harpegnathos saltator TaxID=610380 RepID=E2BQZ3_HARSA|nr:hypothetical protein EAI_17383 [Harpegnathos saltator]
MADGGWSAEKETSSDRAIGYVPSDSEGNAPGTPPRFSGTGSSSACDSSETLMRISSSSKESGENLAKETMADGGWSAEKETSSDRAIGYVKATHLVRRPGSQEPDPHLPASPLERR